MDKFETLEKSMCKELEAIEQKLKGGAEMTLDFDSNLSAAIEKCEKTVVDEYDIVRQEIGMEAK